MIAGRGAQALSGLRVLVVEDEVLIAMLLEDLLQDLGCKVVGTASNVKQARELVASERPDAALLDVNLGTEPAYPIAETLTRAEIPFVFVTGYGEAGLIEAYRGHATIKKPINPETFGTELAAGLRQTPQSPTR